SSGEHRCWPSLGGEAALHRLLLVTCHPAPRKSDLALRQRVEWPERHHARRRRRAHVAVVVVEHALDLLSLRADNVAGQRTACADAAGLAEVQREREANRLLAFAPVLLEQRF